MREIQKRVEDIQKVDLTKESVSQQQEQPAKERVLFERRSEFAVLQEDWIPIPPLTKQKRRSW